MEQHRVFGGDEGHHVVAIERLQQQPRDVQERGVGVLDQGGEDVGQDVIHVRAPAVGPGDAQGVHDGGHDAVALPGWLVGGEVERDGALWVGRVEVDKICNAGRRDVVRELLGDLTVRIDEGYSLTVLDVLGGGVQGKGGFAGTGAADGIEVHVTSSNEEQQGDATGDQLDG